MPRRPSLVPAGPSTLRRMIESDDASTVDVLAIAAHRDDVELTCGGTLIKCAWQGRRTGIVDLSQGELGTRGSAQIRRAESERAAEVLGVSVRENLALPDAG